VRTVPVFSILSGCPRNVILSKEEFHYPESEDAVVRRASIFILRVDEPHQVARTSSSLQENLVGVREKKQ
jgi:hypothetical protein